MTPVPEKLDIVNFKFLPFRWDWVKRDTTNPKWHSVRHTSTVGFYGIKHIQQKRLLPMVQFYMQFIVLYFTPITPPTFLRRIRSSRSGLSSGCYPFFVIPLQAMTICLLESQISWLNTKNSSWRTVWRPKRFFKRAGPGCEIGYQVFMSWNIYWDSISYDGTIYRSLFCREDFGTFSLREFYVNSVSILQNHYSQLRNMEWF